MILNGSHGHKPLALLAHHPIACYFQLAQKTLITWMLIVKIVPKNIIIAMYQDDSISYVIVCIIYNKH